MMQFQKGMRPLRSMVQNRKSLMTIRNKSTSPLHGDEGNLATHVYHGMTTGLALATPVMFIFPMDGMPNKIFGLGVAGVVSAHSWIGLNYVATDYVPKVSKSLLGPSRVVCAGIGLVTLLGLGKIAINDEGGLPGAVKALWTTPKKEQEESK